MDRIAAVAALAIAAGLPFSVSAGDFGRATWGMSLAQVRKLHPGGTVAKGEADNTIYLVHESFGPIKAAQIVFGFPRDTLTYVEVHFPRPGTVPDPKAIRYATMSTGQATEAYASLREYLVSKHGTPFDDRTGLHSSWEVRGTPGSTIQLTLHPLEGADDLRDVTLEYTDGSIYGFSEDKSPPADCSATERTYTSLKKIERDRECAIGKTGQLTCRLDHVEDGSMKVKCGKDWAFFGYEEANAPQLGMLKPGNRYLFTFKVMECSWAEMSLKFIGAKPAR
jgi:hypothetical protein